jgi:uncharacterized protein
MTTDERPLSISVTDLRRRAGNRAEVDRTVPLGPVEISASRVPDGAMAHVHLTLEALSDGVTLVGTVEVPWEGDCRRCLEPTSGTVVAEVSEVYKDRPESPEFLPIENDAIDVSAAVHDAAVLALPLAPLCRDDCPGPHPDEFPVATADEPLAAPEDPRWAALAELRFDSDPPE